MELASKTNWVEKGKESIDDKILNQWPQNDGMGFGINKASIEFLIIFIIITIIIIKIKLRLRLRFRLRLRISYTQKIRIRITFDLDKISELGRNIYEWNQIKSTNQYSKLTSIEHSRMNKVAWHFEDLEYLNTINIQ